MVARGEIGLGRIGTKQSLGQLQGKRPFPHSRWTKKEVTRREPTAGETAAESLDDRVMSMNILPHEIDANS